VKLIAQLFLLFAFASFSLAADNQRLSQEDDIREAVFRYQFEHNASAQQTNSKVYFLGVAGKSGDPSEELIKRLAGHKPPVRKASASHYVKGKGILDKKTGEQGLAFSINSIKWVSDSEVEADGGYYEAEKSSSANVYTLKKQNGKWHVTKNKLKWIS